MIIYTLTDPRDNQIKYVGKTNNIKRRMQEHLVESSTTKKNNWIKSLRKQNLKPIIEILDEETDDPFWEIYWISQIKTWGFTLKNMTEGGDFPPIKFGEDNVFKRPDVAAKILLHNKNRKGKTLRELYGEEKAKEISLNRSKKFSGKNNPNLKGKVYQYDLFFNFIKEWSTLYDIKVYFNKDVSGISKCFKDINKTSMGYRWSREKRE